MTKTYNFTPYIDSYGRKFIIIPTIEVFSNKNDTIVFEESLKNFSEKICRKILVEHYNFSPTEDLCGGIDINQNQFYLFEKHVDLKPNFLKFSYQLSFDHHEYL